MGQRVVMLLDGEDNWKPTANFLTNKYPDTLSIKLLIKAGSLIQPGIKLKPGATLWHH